MRLARRATLRDRISRFPIPNYLFWSWSLILETTPLAPHPPHTSHTSHTFPLFPVPRSAVPYSPFPKIANSLFSY
ncbi:hypothetical protein [Moorena sp. SIO4G3]|uniref:hypothetical protein n=1 Tax=Moorena sp. SIO4G3 TaxID=2607821 RepID=UPI00142BB9AB|nr:hypothetical protein [Moorena sp. SIO4G3]NEO75820.1 hypothetical protein [Moorena sp. SIO4G3]